MYFISILLIILLPCFHLPAMEEIELQTLIFNSSDGTQKSCEYSKSGLELEFDMLILILELDIDEAFLKFNREDTKEIHEYIVTRLNTIQANAKKFKQYFPVSCEANYCLLSSTLNHLINQREKELKNCDLKQIIKMIGDYKIEE